MKNIIDITGEIYDGMWNYEPPFPKFNLKPLPDVPWVKGKVYCEIFEGLHSQTGTYLETPAHYFGNDKCYLVTDVDIKSLYEMDCKIIHLEEYMKDKNTGITQSMIKKALKGQNIKKNQGILISTGWGEKWKDDNYLKDSPYITKTAMEYLVSLQPYLLGSDFARWENMKSPEGIFDIFYNADILMLAPCVNLEKIKSNNCKLTVMPLNIPKTSCVPCRAVVVKEK